MPGPLPGTPPVVLHARAIVRRDLRVRVRNALIGIGIAGLLALGAATVGWGVEVLVTTLPTLPMVGLLTSPIPDSERHDARTILDQWEVRRDGWAQEMLDASVRDAADDVAAWSAASRALSTLRDNAS